MGVEVRGRPKALYEAFPPAQAWAILQRLEFHFGARAATRALTSSGSSSAWVLPSRYGVLSW
jgi:hypothetical protein